MSLFVKICGITSSEAAEVAVAAGVDALGFVFAQSPRQISPSRAAEIGRVVPRNVEKVAVFLNPQPGEIESVLDGFDADTVQADWPSLTEIVAPEVLPVLRDAMPTKLAGRRVLFEGRFSGVGVPADWSVAAGLARRSSLILAGGLHEGNVRSAINSVHPFGVDVSSGVESSRGIKDVGLIDSFVNEVREIEKEAVTA